MTTRHSESWFVFRAPLQPASPTSRAASMVADAARRPTTHARIDDRRTALATVRMNSSRSGAVVRPLRPHVLSGDLRVNRSGYWSSPWCTDRHLLDEMGKPPRRSWRPTARSPDVVQSGERRGHSRGMSGALKLNAISALVLAGCRSPRRTSSTWRRVEALPER